ncbi:HNH endonuclease signature motif containing protein [Pseudonocardia halophobica]|uniref:HNH endonuclease signature motif containing protein n=1 Tax=Pseudonocardia halophobica TaxID=29401 RepID=UPI0018CBFC07|nr:HNH endonuclease signature motif containing protein [Pseudonocardia halophobica]
MQQVVALPKDLAAMPPGPELAAALASIDLAATANEDLPVLLQARYRQVAHEQAGLYDVMAQIGVADPERWFSAARRARPQKYWSDEVRAALTWTRRAAEYQTELAWVLHAHLPSVAEALRAGVIDLPKARVFADHLADLSPEQAAALVAWVLPRAVGWTTGQLAARLRALVADLDPAHFEKRYRRAVAGREVIGMLCDDGTVTITAVGLPADQAQAAIDRVDRLALAIRRAGHPSPVAHLRADVFLGLLDGSLHHLTRDQIIREFLTRAAAEVDGDADAGQAASERADAQPKTRTADVARAASAAEESPGCSGDGGSGSEDTDSRDNGDHDNRDRGRWDSRDGAESRDSDRGAGGDGDGDDRVNAASTADTRPTPAASPEVEPVIGAPLDESADDARRGIHVRAALSTLLGRNDRHVLLPGQGPIPASVGRGVVARQRGALWRFALVDQQGRFVRGGIVRARPAPPTDPPPRTRTARRPTGGLVDIILLTEAELDALLGPRAGGPPDPVPDAGGHDWRPVLSAIRRALDRPESTPGNSGDARRRFPRAGLRRHVQLRDQTCTFVGCRAPAERTDLDHTVDHARGGRTTDDDLGPACRHDHGLKQAGWTLDQPEPGVFRWTSPLGRTYVTTADPLLPEPPPQVPHGADANLDVPPFVRPDDEACGLIEPVPPEPERDRPAVDLDEEPDEEPPF